MKPKGLLLALMGKKSDDDDDDAPPSSSRGSEDRAEELAGEVFDALQDEDREAFAEALLSLIYHCQE